MEKLKKILDNADYYVQKWYSDYYREIEYFNHEKVLNAFRSHEISYHHFRATTGYGLGDTGRDTLEEVWSEVFHGEDSLIRQQIVSGTHSISLALFGMLLPGDHMVILGEPYDTLFKVLGRTKDDPGSLMEMGVTYEIFPLDKAENLELVINNDTKVLYLQRSKGYEFRKALTIDDIRKIIKSAKAINPNIIVFVDNCYGEFVEKEEPLEAGADLIAGSLIKNAGGTIATAGGYLCGRKDLIERASYRLTAPGVGKEIGPSLMSNTCLYQGLYMAPHIVSQALQGSVYIAKIFSDLGYKVCPQVGERRGDIVEAIQFNDKEMVKSICRGIQNYSPVDSNVFLEDWDMPGYEDKVIMASGGFVEGSSIELSADAPMRPPYNCFIQGGASYFYVKMAIDNILMNKSIK